MSTQAPDQAAIDTVVRVAQHRDRMTPIVEEMERLNRVRRPDDPPIGLPFDLESRALLHALVTVLIQRGIITDSELLPLKLNAIEQIAAAALQEGKEARAGRSGIVGPHGEAL